MVRNHIHPSWMNTKVPDLAISVLEQLNAAYSASGTIQDLIFPRDLHTIFYPFRVCPLDKIKMLLIGLEPPQPSTKNPKGWYYTGVPYDSPRSAKKPHFRTLQVLDAFKDDITASPLEGESYLYPLLKSGVLAMNLALTGITGFPKAHVPIWRRFSETVLITALSIGPVPIMVLSAQALSEIKNYAINPEVLLNFHEKVRRARRYG